MKENKTKENRIQPDKTEQGMRVLDLYVRLTEGKTINKTEEAKKYGVAERTIKRDFDTITAFFSERSIQGLTDTRNIEYDRSQKGYCLKGSEASLMTNSEILAVSKILLESRAFTKREIETILDKLIQGCVPLKNIKLVTDLISNEKFHYTELHHHSHFLDKLWEIGVAIEENRRLEIEYEKASSAETVKRIVEPVAILFSEYYFYMNAFLVKQDEEGRCVRRFDYPAIFRIDRIKSFRETGERFTEHYANRFEEGEFRKRIQFMYAGELMKIQFRFTGSSPEPVLDRLPTARVVPVSETNIAGKENRIPGMKDYIIEAEVYGKGIVMWLLSQGSSVEVLKPESFRDEMRDTLKKMLKGYGEGFEDWKV